MMNKGQQKTVNEMIKAMELDTYGEKGLKEIIRQVVVEMVKLASQKREPLSDEILCPIAEARINDEGIAGFYDGFRYAEKHYGIGE